MKIFAFSINNERRFVHLTCNIILVATLLFVSILSFSPSNFDVYTTAGGAYYCGNKTTGKVSLMINVYWGTEYLDDMLQTLENKGVKTTFFVGGSWVAKNGDMLKKIVEKGHEVGNHGYFHKDHTKLTLKQGESEISATHNLVKTLAGIEMNLFAPPSGSVNSTVVTSAENLGYKTIMWSKDTIDWRDKDENLIFNRATKNISSGDLVLMHPTKETSLALGKIIDTILSKNLSITPVSQVIV